MAAAINAANTVEEEYISDALTFPALAKWANRKVRIGFWAEILTPGRRSVPARSMISTLNY